jgi:hypothetical protein
MNFIICIYGWVYVDTTNPQLFEHTAIIWTTQNFA